MVETTAGVLELRDGRDMGYSVEGDLSGVPLVMHHGTPEAGLRDPRVAETCRKRGVTPVSFTRPGYGTSTRQPGRAVADIVSDVVELLDHLGVDRFLTLGWSGGGPHALACAALLPGRCRAAASVAGLAPFDSAGKLNFLEGMAPENVDEYGAALRGADELRLALEPGATAIQAAGPEEVGDLLNGLLSPADEIWLTAEFAGYVHDAMRRATAAGVWGWVDDDLALVRPWGFALTSLSEVPVSVWQGRDDRMVPVAHAQYLSDAVPGSRLRLFQGEGHLSLLRHLGDIVDELLHSSEASWTTVR